MPSPSLCMNTRCGLNGKRAGHEGVKTAMKPVVGWKSTLAAKHAQIRFALLDGRGMGEFLSRRARCLADSRGTTAYSTMGAPAAHRHYRAWPSLHIRRVKNGTPVAHPLSGREMRERRGHQRQSAQSAVRLCLRGGTGERLRMVARL
jgi:hypothetical protein